MLLEISIAVGYIQSQLYTKLPRRRIDNFGDELTRLLTKRYQNHWFVDDPKQESAYRALNTNNSETSPVFLEAAASSNLEWSEIAQCLPRGLIIELDPGNVTCQFSSSENANGSLTNGSPPTTMNNILWNNSSSGCSSASSETSNSNQIISHTLYSSSNETLTDVSKVPNIGASDGLENFKLESIFADEGVAFSPSENWPLIQNNNSQSNGIFNQREPNLLNNNTNSITSGQTLGPSAFIQYNKSHSNPTPQPTTTSRVLALAANQSNPELIMMKNSTSDVQKPTVPSGTQPNSNATANQAFTAAMFAQTKFGSTKLKSNTKKNKRFVSPNDMSRTSQNNNNGSSEGNGSHYYNSNQKQDSSNSKQEMLREALQYQQQLLKNVEFRNNSNFNTKLQQNIPQINAASTSSSVNLASSNHQTRIANVFNSTNSSNANCHETAYSNIWPTPIGAQRKANILPLQQQNPFFNPRNENENLLKLSDDFEGQKAKGIQSKLNGNIFWPSQHSSGNPWSGFLPNETNQLKWSQSDPASGNLSNDIFSSPFLFNPIGQSNMDKSQANQNSPDDMPIQQFNSINLDSITS